MGKGFRMRSHWARKVRAVSIAAASGLALISCSTQVSVAQGASGCRAMTDRVQGKIDYVKELVSSTDTNRVAMRQSLGVAQASASKVTLVTKTSTCQSAVTGLNTILGTPGIARQVYVIATGNGYAVDDPSLDVLGRGADLFFLTKTFGYQAIVNGF